MRRWTALAVFWFAALLPAQSEVAELVARLSSEDGSQRSAAYMNLLRRRDPAMVPLLSRDITGMPRGGQQYAIYLLRGLPGRASLAALRGLLEADSAYLRVAAAASLAQQRQAGAEAKLAAALTSTPESERTSVLYLVATIKEDEVLQALLGWLHADAPESVVTSVLRQLARRSSGLEAAIRDHVAPLAQASSLGIRAAALAWLARSDRRHGEALAAILQDEPARFWAVRDLLDTDAKLAPALVEAITEALAAPRSKHDIAATAALLQRQSRGSAVAVLRELLRHDKEDFRAAALEVLAGMSGALDDKDARELLAGEHVAARLIAVDLLRRRDDMSGLPVMLELVPKTVEDRRKFAEVLGRFRDRRVAPMLLDLLDDDDTSVRLHAWTGLQALMRGLFPYRRFDFASCGYAPQGDARQAGIATLRAWWAAAK